MAAPRNEKQLTNQIIAAIKRTFPKDVWILKTHGVGFQRAGVPDLLLCVRGIFVGLEVKHRKPGESEKHMLGRVSTLQRVELAGIKDAGGIAEVVWSVTQALEIVALTRQVAANQLL